MSRGGSADEQPGNPNALQDDRDFDPARHIVKVRRSQSVDMADGRGGVLDGIHARTAIRAFGLYEVFIGLDRVTMEPGSAFEPHTHPGDHILYILEGVGGVVIDGVLHRVEADDAVYIPAERAHGVTTVPEYDRNFVLLAFGVPHKPADAPDRMTLVDRVQHAHDIGSNHPGHGR